MKKRYTLTVLAFLLVTSQLFADGFTDRYTTYSYGVDSLNVKHCIQAVYYNGTVPNLNIYAIVGSDFDFADASSVRLLLRPGFTVSTALPTNYSAAATTGVAFSIKKTADNSICNWILYIRKIQKATIPFALNFGAAYPYNTATPDFLGWAYRSVASYNTPVLTSTSISHFLAFNPSLSTDSLVCSYYSSSNAASDQTGSSSAISASNDGVNWSTLKSYSNNDVPLNNATTAQKRLALALPANTQYLRFILPTKAGVANFSANSFDMKHEAISNSTTALNVSPYILGSGPSNESSFTLSGSALTANLIITPPVNFEISLTSGADFASTPITLTKDGVGTVPTTTVYTRLAAGLAAGNYAGSISLSATGSVSKTITCSASVYGIASSVSTLTGLNYLPNCGPSAEQSFTVTGVGLNNNISITPPANFEISTGTAGAFAPTSPIVLSKDGNGAVASTPIYVRMISGLSIAAYSGNMDLSSAGVPSVSIACAGAVASTTVSLTTLTGLNYLPAAGPSAEKSFTVNGSGLAGDLIVAPPSNFEISLTSGAAFVSTPITLSKNGAGTINTTTIYARLSAGLTSANYSGNISVSSTGLAAKTVACTGVVSNEGATLLFASYSFGIKSLNIQHCLYPIYKTGTSPNNFLTAVVASDFDFNDPSALAFVVKTPEFELVSSFPTDFTPAGSATGLSFSVRKIADQTIENWTLYIHKANKATIPYSLNFGAANPVNTVTPVFSGWVYEVIDMGNNYPKLSSTAHTFFLAFNPCLSTDSLVCNYYSNSNNVADQTGNSSAIQASNDGATWTTLKSYSNNDVPLNNATAAQKRLSMVLPVNCQYIRFIYTAKPGSAYYFVNAFDLKHEGITNSSTSLPLCTYGYGGGPFTEHSFTVSGSALTANLILTPPTNFEISTSTGAAFVAANPLTLTKNGSGVVPTTNIYVRAASGLALGDYSGNISLTSTGQTTKTVACNATIVKGTQTLSFGSLAAKIYGESSFTIAATGGASGSPVIFSSSDTNIATCSGTNGTTVTIIGVGTCTISANQAGSANYNAAAAVVQTFTVVSDISTANPIPAGNTNVSALAGCPNCDAVVSAAGTLTIDQTSRVRNITMESGAKLLVSYPLTVQDLTFKAGMTTSFSAKIVDNMTITGSVRFLKTMDDTRWFFISFPCTVSVAAITQSDGSSLGVLGTDWFIKYYDGAQRIQNLGASTNWRNMTDPTLQAYKGYIFGLKAVGTKELLFPLDKSVVASESAREIPVVAYGDGTSTNSAGQTISESNKGWNLIGQPYLSQYAGTGTNANYMVLFDGYYYNTYYKTELSNLDPFAAYFVQANAALATSKVTFSLEARQLAHASVANDLSDRVQLNLTTATGTDKTNLIIDPAQSSAYQIGEDMEKWLTTGTSKPQLYTSLNGINYAYNALPVENVQSLPLGIYTNATGLSTISTTGTQAPSLSQLLLTDHTMGITTDLLLADYSFTAYAGTSNTRFSISAQRLATTSKLTLNKAELPYLSMTNDKLLIDNILNKTIIRVYDVFGRNVLSAVSQGGTIELALPQPGVYSVKIQFGEKCWTKNIISPVKTSCFF